MFLTAYIFDVYRAVPDQQGHFFFFVVLHKVKVSRPQGYHTTFVFLAFCAFSGGGRFDGGRAAAVLRPEMERIANSPNTINPVSTTSRGHHPTARSPSVQILSPLSDTMSCSYCTYDSCYV